MKIKHIPLLFLILITVSLSQQKHSFGFVGTYNSTNLIINKSIENSYSKTGFGIGLFLKVPISANFSAHGEIHYIAKHFQYETVSNSTTIKLNCAIKYLHIPISLQAKINTPFVSPFAELGFYISQKLSSDPNSFLFSAPGSSSSVIAPVTFTSSASGLLLGLGIEIPMSNFKSILIGYRFSPGESTIGEGINYLSPWKTRFSLFYLGIII